MKARKRNSNDDWQEVEYVQLKDSYVITKADQMEFENENSVSTSTDWEQVRINTAIAAMQGTITILSSSDRSAFREIVVEGFRGDKKTYPNEIAEFAIACADELVKRLKGE